jgi:hypothetical protein
MNSSKKIQKKKVLRKSTGNPSYHYGLSELSEVWGAHSLTPKNPSLELGLHFTVFMAICVNQF